MTKEALVKWHLSRLKTKETNSQNIYLVKDLADVLKRPPFTTNQPIYTFCDLDGVAISFSNKEGANFSSLLALARIAKASQELTLWSLRLKVSDNFLPAVFDSESVSCFPVINDRSLIRLRNFFSKVAPETETYFELGLGKLAKQGLFPQVNQALDEPSQEAVLIGSSVFDRLEMGKLLGKLPKEKRGRLWYFDTGGAVL